MDIEKFPEFTIKEYLQSQLIAFAENGNEHIADHIINGYGIPLSDGRSKLEIIKDEYQHGEDRTRVFLAFEEDKVIGSMYFILWRNSNEDKRGGKFKEFLINNSNGLLNLEELDKHKILACDIGIVIDPAYHGKGVANNLYAKGLESVNPAFLVGQTKTPAAVIARTRILNELGYETSYGGRSLSLLPELSKLLAEAYFFSRKDVLERVDGTCVHYAKTDGLQPEIKVDLDRLPEYVRINFEQIIEVDRIKPEGYITFSPLISIKKELVR